MFRHLARRAAPYLLAVAAAVGGGLALLPEPPAAAPPPRADFVIIVGIAGLRWDDVDRIRTPNLWRLAERGSIGALTVRSARAVTCSVDGWLTLGAGNRARRANPEDRECPPLRVPIEQPQEPGAVVTDQRAVVQDNRRLPWDVQPGALAEAVRCTTAIGPGGAIAGARPFGRVDRYLPAVGPGLARQLAACSLTLIDLGEVAGEGSARRAGVTQADRALAAVLKARPERSLIVVAGLSETGGAGHLHVAVADGPGYRGGLLTSASTGRPGYLQLIDLAPTALAALNRPAPAELFAGTTAEWAGDRTESLSAAVRRLADADRQGSVQRSVAARFFTALAVGQTLLLFGLIPVFRRTRRPAGPAGPAPLPRWLRRTAEIALIAAALAVPAALTADLVPWWRWSSPGIVFASVALGLLAVATAGVVLVTRRRHVLGPVGGVAAVAAVAVAVDVITGSRLQLNGVAGYSAATSGRYAGLGTIGLGLLVGGTLLFAGALAQRVPRGWRSTAVAGVGAIGVIVVGSPQLGADGAGAVALSAGACLAAVAATGGWFTLPRFASSALVAGVVTGGFALVDLARPAERRSNVGRFLVDLGDGTGGLVGERLGEQNVVAIATSPITPLVIGTAAFAGVLLLRPWGGLRRLFGLYPAIRAALGGIGLATVFAGLVEGVGFNVLGAALAVAGPLVAFGALRVLDHANDRTQPAEEVPPVSPLPRSICRDTDRSALVTQGEVLA